MDHDNHIGSGVGTDTIFLDKEAGNKSRELSCGGNDTCGYIDNQYLWRICRPNKSPAICRNSCEGRRVSRTYAIQDIQLAQLQYRAGTLNYIEVLDAQRRYFEAQIELNNAIRDEYLALIDLYKALGGGWNPD